MRKLFLALFLLVATSCFAQQSDLRFSGVLTATCSNATSSCLGTAGSTVENSSSANSQGVQPGLSGYSVATITVSGTYSGATIFFEFSDDGGITWFQNTCSRSDVAIQEGSEALPNNQTRAWDCGISGTSKIRVRASALSSGSINVGFTVNTAGYEPAPTMQLSINGTAGSNPCANPHASLTSTSVATSGTAATQFIAAVSGQKIYLCSFVLGNGAGTTPTFQLQYGTGTNCGTGTASILPNPIAPPTASGNSNPFVLTSAHGFFVTPASQAVCYIQTGTTPTATVIVNYVQQ